MQWSKKKQLEGHIDNKIGRLKYKLKVLSEEDRKLKMSLIFLVCITSEKIMPFIETKDSIEQNFQGDEDNDFSFERWILICQ